MYLINHISIQGQLPRWTRATKRGGPMLLNCYELVKKSPLGKIPSIS